MCPISGEIASFYRFYRMDRDENKDTTKKLLENITMKDNGIAWLILSQFLIKKMYVSLLRMVRKSERKSPVV